MGHCGRQSRPDRRARTGHGDRMERCREQVYSLGENLSRKSCLPQAILGGGSEHRNNRVNHGGRHAARGYVKRRRRQSPDFGGAMFVSTEDLVAGNRRFACGQRQPWAGAFGAESRSRRTRSFAWRRPGLEAFFAKLWARARSRWQSRRAAPNEVSNEDSYKTLTPSTQGGDLYTKH